MSDVRLLEKRFGGWWCGVKFGHDADTRARRAVRPMRFCEAIAASRISPIVLTPGLLNCPGGSRCLGWNDQEDVVERGVADKAEIDIEIARKLVQNTPRLEADVDRVTIGTYESPDVVISYAQPKAAMNLLRSWQIRYGSPLLTQASGFMSVCGAVAVKAYLSQRICISFGCPDAREHGDIGRDRLVIGLPMHEARSLARNPPSKTRTTAQWAASSKAGDR